MFIIVFLISAVVCGFIGFIIDKIVESMMPFSIFGILLGMFLSFPIATITDIISIENEDIIIEEYSYINKGISYTDQLGNVENIECDDIIIKESDKDYVYITINKGKVIGTVYKTTIYIPKDMKNDSSFSCSKCGFSNFLDYFKFCPECGEELK